ncbi:MAG: OmpA family protein [Georgfuchsia sp.]
MQKKRYFPLMILAASILAACNSMPHNNASLDEARNDYATAQNTPAVVQLAAPELKDAGIALDLANAAFIASDDDENVSQLSYIAKQKIATTQEVAKRKSAELTVANADIERNQIRLEQRTAEADRARNDATIAQNKAADAQANTLDAQAETVDAQMLAVDAVAYSHQLEDMLIEMSAKQTGRGMMVTLSDVLFNVDQSQLKPNGLRNVQKLGEFMRQYPLRTVLIEGYTDSTGSSAHNMELSTRRAEAVSTALDSMGISLKRIATHGYGEAYPIAANDTASNRQMNRRVEIVLSEDNGHIAPR